MMEDLSGGPAASAVLDSAGSDEKSSGGDRPAGASRPIPEEALIVLPVRNLVVFPTTVLPIAIGRERSQTAVQEAVRLERPIGINETKRLLAARFDEVPVTKTYTADLARHGYLDAGQKQLSIPMHYVIRNAKNGGLGQFALMPGKARIFQDDGRGTTAFLGEDWAGFTPRDAEMSLSLGVARDVVVKRTIADRQAKRSVGNLQDYAVTVKFEVENFKDQPVVLDIAESMTALRSEILGNSGRAVEWELDKGGTMNEPDAEKSTADRPLFHVKLPARGSDQKAQKVECTLKVIIKNEW